MIAGREGRGEEEELQCHGLGGGGGRGVAGVSYRLGLRDCREGITTMAPGTSNLKDKHFLTFLRSAGLSLSLAPVLGYRRSRVPLVASLRVLCPPPPSRDHLGPPSLHPFFLSVFSAYKELSRVADYTCENSFLPARSLCPRFPTSFPAVPPTVALLSVFLT